MLVLSVTDAFLTVRLMTDGAEETNPLLAFVLNEHPRVFALVKMALTGGGVLLLVAVARMRLFRVVRAGLLMPVLALAYLGVLSHVFLDFLNPYGIRLLMPFDSRWLYGDALFIIDPWLWLILGGGIWLARRGGTTLPAIHALTLATVYILSMWTNAQAARGIVLDEWRRTRGGEPASLMVGPVPVTPFRRQVIVDNGLAYETGIFTWFPAQVSIDRTVVPKNDTDVRVARAREAPHIRGFLVWARFPFWTFEEVSGGTRVSVGERSACRGRSSGTRPSPGCSRRRSSALGTG